MATFPSYACILLAGYDEEPDFGIIRSAMDGGIAKQRPRRSIAVVTRSATIRVLSKAAKASFDAWVKSDLDYGAGWFTYVDPLDSVSKQARLAGGKYKWSSPGVIWLASCQIETLG